MCTILNKIQNTKYKLTIYDKKHADINIKYKIKIGINLFTARITVICETLTHTFLITLEC